MSVVGGVRVFKSLFGFNLVGVVVVFVYDIKVVVFNCGFYFWGLLVIVVEVRGIWI